MREITGYILDSTTGQVIIFANDISESNFQRIERYGSNYIEERNESYVFNTKQQRDFISLRIFLKKQKSTKNAKTYKDALISIVGTTTDTYSIRKYRQWA